MSHSSKSSPRKRKLHDSQDDQETKPSPTKRQASCSEAQNVGMILPTATYIQCPRCFRKRARSSPRWILVFTRTSKLDPGPASSMTSFQQTAPLTRCSWRLVHTSRPSSPLARRARSPLPSHAVSASPLARRSTSPKCLRKSIIYIGHLFYRV